VECAGSRHEWLSKRFKAVAQNIANVNTPGYARSEVTFENELREALNMKDDEKLALTTTDDAHISNVPAMWPP